MLISEQFITQFVSAVESILRTHDEAMSRCDQEDRYSIRHDTACNIVNLLCSVIISNAEPSATMVHVSDLSRAIRNERINMIRCASKSPFLSVDDVERLADLMESEANDIEADFLASQSRRAAESDCHGVFGRIEREAPCQQHDSSTVTPTRRCHSSACPT